MAGIQFCCRKFLVSNASRVLYNNGVILQPIRKRHHLVVQISSIQSKRILYKSKLIFNPSRLPAYRLASTNAPELDKIISNGVNTNQSNNIQNIVESSNGNVVIDDKMLPPIPITEPVEPPVLEFVSMGLKEPSFQSLGLGSWWPSGWVQHFMEYLHIGLGLPWWEAIIVVSLVARVLLLPINLKTRIDSINMSNNLPELQKIQVKINNARMTGDYYAAATHTQELQDFVKEKNLNMLSLLRNALIQGPVFISIFYGLKGMANVPVESLKTEGLFWFTDLTVPDPYFILPVILSGTLLTIIEIGAEGNPARANSHTMKWVLRGIPAFVFLVTLNFPSCITWYWTISNFVVLAQVGLFKIPIVKKTFKIPESIRIDTSQLPQSKGFVEGFKEGFAQAKMKRQIEERERMNINAFKKAGTAPVPRTFKNNPLLQKEKKSS